MLTSEYYLPCIEFHDEHFQLKIFHVDRIDRDIDAKNRRKLQSYLCEYAITSTKFLGRWLSLG